MTHEGKNSGCTKGWWSQKGRRLNTMLVLLVLLQQCANQTLHFPLDMIAQPHDPLSIPPWCSRDALLLTQRHEAVSNVHLVKSRNLPLLVELAITSTASP
jgi:hypothetical protein